MIGNKINHSKIYKKNRKAELIFYLSIVTIPVIQFCIFYVGVNFNSFRLAFSQFDSESYSYYFIGFKNFNEIIMMLKSEGSVLLYATKNSLIVYLANLIIGTPLALFFSFYIYKKMQMHKIFQVILFLPSIISNIVLVLIFKYSVNYALPEFISKIFHHNIDGLLSLTSVKTHLPAIIFFGVLFSFGTNVLLYSGAMSKISPEIVESAELDGATHFKEFFYITLPQIYPTLSTFILVGVAGIFVNQASLFSFFGEGAEYSTYTTGYYIFKNVLSSQATNSDYCHLSAVGLFFSAFVVPFSLLLRWILNKMDPNN